MKKEPVRRRTAEMLREKAEFRMRSGAGRDIEAEGDATAIKLKNLRLAYELEVHQIELEMQSEELMAMHEQADAAMDRYDFGPAGLLTLRATGEIRELNVAGGTMLGASRAALVGQRLGAMVVLPERAGFNAFLERVFETQSKQTLECTILRSNRTLVRVLIAARTSPDGKECRAVMLDLGDSLSFSGEDEIGLKPVFKKN
jgi:PAS domain-containing protein